MKKSKEYILKRIKESPAIESPWRHLVIDNFLPNSLYELIKQETGESLSRKEIVGTENKGIRAYHINVNKSVGVKPPDHHKGLQEYYRLLQDSDIEYAIKEKVNTVHHENVASVVI